MTRKDFRAIAEAVRSAGRHPDRLAKGWSEAVELVALNLAAVLRDTNPNFDRQRFLDACNPED